MTTFFRAVPVALLSVSALFAQAKPDAETKEDLPEAEDRVAPDHESMRYFLIGPDEKAKKKKAPKGGYRLLLLLPGGTGSADFVTFCRRIAKNTVDLDEYLVAQLVAPAWTEEQARNVVWPHAKSGVREAEFTTEEFIDAVIRDVEATHELDRDYIFTLCWSSSGPACYMETLREESRVTGSFLAMAAFKPDQFGSLKRAKGHPYYLLHSPDEKVVPFRMAEDAEKRLSKKGAKVELVEYAGGHGWHGDVYGNIRRGIRWLEKRHAKAKKVPKSKSPTPRSAGKSDEKESGSK